MKWTAYQLDTLRDIYGALPLPVVAARLGRSPSAVEKRAEELGMSQCTAQGLFTCRQVEHAMGVSWSVVSLWLDAGLRCYDGPGVGRARMRMFAADELVVWLCGRPELIPPADGISPRLCRTMGIDIERLNAACRDGYMRQICRRSELHAVGAPVTYWIPLTSQQSLCPSCGRHGRRYADGPQKGRYVDVAPSLSVVERMSDRDLAVLREFGRGLRLTTAAAELGVSLSNAQGSAERLLMLGLVSKVGSRHVITAAGLVVVGGEG